MIQRLLLGFFLFATLTTHAYDFENEGFYFNIISLNDLTVQLTYGETTDTRAADDDAVGIIPAYEGDVTVPSTTVYAGKLFSVISIDEYAFENCKLGTLTIPPSIVECEAVGVWADKLIIEDGENPIKCFDSIFAGYITDYVYLGRPIEGVRSGQILGGGYCKEIEFGKYVTFLDEACAGNTGLTSVKLPETIKSLKRAFEDCSSLVSIDAPGVEEINSAFRFCTNLESVNLPMLRIIGGEAFEGCSSLKSFSFSPGLLTIGIWGESRGIFYSCENLESVTLPASLSTIGLGSGMYSNSETFANCPNLKTITVCNPIPAKIAESNFDIMTYLTATLKVPVGAGKAYRNADVWKNFIYIVEDPEIPDNIYAIWCFDESGNNCAELVVDEALPPYDTTTHYPVLFAKKGEKLTIKLNPDQVKYQSGDFEIKGWLEINGIDVTSDVKNNIYETTVESGMDIVIYYWQDNAVEEVKDNQELVYNIGDVIYILNSEEEPFYIYNAAGINIFSGQSVRGQTSVKVQPGNIYIVKLKNKTYKIRI